MIQEIITSEQAKKADISELISKLSTNKAGLLSSEAEKRLEQFGYNEIAEKKTNPIIKFLSNFWGPIPWMIEVAIILSALVGHWEDLVIISSLLLVNAVVKFWEEHQADNAIELLKQKLAIEARVKRNGEWVSISARELVPGDIIRVRLGDIIPADIKLMEGNYLLVDQAALTGESLPIEKHISDMAYSGSIIKQGEMDAIIVGTGMNTFFGKTTELIEKGKGQSHFQKAILKIGNFLIVFAAVLVVLVVIVAILRQTSLLETLQFALVLTVASIPVALPAVLSVTMAIGALALAKKDAIVSKLASIEELAGVDILCSDKTGTITKNEISVAKFNLYGEYTEEDILMYATLASRKEDKDPIDDAIISKAFEKEDIKEIISKYTISNFMPFDPISKRTEATVTRDDGKLFKVSKGAPQVILSLSSNKEQIADNVNEAINDFAAKGYRALGVARTLNSNNDWQFIGLIALFDPPREDSADTITTTKSMGLNVKMVTGDHASIAKEIAKSVNMGTDIIPIASLFDNGMISSRPECDDLLKSVENADGFAEVYPEHKYAIIECLQKAGHIVGMTGDGVNDAPALKKADVGIAVANATDAAKSAADITFTKPGLSVIIDATIESRKIFQRMLNYSTYRIAETIRVIIFIALSIIIFQFYPVTALMIVLLAILNDAPIMTIAFDNVDYSNKPERWDMQRVLILATVLGILGVIASFGIYIVGLTVFHLNPTILQSFIYLKLSVAGHLTIFVVRTKGHFWEKKPAKPLFLAIIITQAIATIIVVYGILLPAMGWGLAVFVWGYALVFFLITDFIKVYLNKFLDSKREKRNL
ncbi:MAG: plasma-membrane proton-efflux P-type ATPase [Promethearchaeota archaeon]